MKKSINIPIGGDIIRSTCDRGTFTNIPVDKFQRVYFIKNHKINTIRAWHFHRAESILIYCLKGAWKVGKYEEGEQPKFTIIEEGEFVYVPSGYGNGHMNLTEDAILMCCADLPLEMVRDDETKEPFDKFRGFWEIESR